MPMVHRTENLWAPNVHSYPPEMAYLPENASSDVFVLRPRMFDSMFWVSYLLILVTPPLRKKLNVKCRPRGFPKIQEILNTDFT